MYPEKSSKHSKSCLDSWTWTRNQSDSGTQLPRLAPLAMPKGNGPRRAEQHQSEQENTLPAQELRLCLCTQGYKLCSALVYVRAQLMIAPHRLYNWSRKQWSIVAKGSKSAHTNPLRTDVFVSKVSYTDSIVFIIVNTINNIWQNWATLFHLQCL